MLHQQQILRAGQDETPGRVGLAVDGILDIRKQLGGTLNLVQDDRLSVEPGEKSQRIRAGAFPLIRPFQRDASVVGECLPSVPAKG